MATFLSCQQQRQLVFKMPINYTNKILIGGTDMSEGPQFNATSESGEIKQAMKIVEGDEVQGHKGNVVDTGGGNIEGDVNQTYNEAANEVVEYVDNLEAEFNKAVAENETRDPASVEAREIPDKEPVDTVITPFEEFDVESIDAENPDPPQVFSAMRSMAAAPPEAADPEKAEGLFSRFKTMATKAGPKVGKALLAGSVAALKATIKTHPLVAGVTTALEEFQE